MIFNPVSAGLPCIMHYPHIRYMIFLSYSTYYKGSMVFFVNTLPFALPTRYGQRSIPVIRESLIYVMEILRIILISACLDPLADTKRFMLEF